MLTKKLKLTITYTAFLFPVLLCISFWEINNIANEMLRLGMDSQARYFAAQFSQEQTLRLNEFKTFASTAHESVVRESIIGVLWLTLLISVAITFFEMLSLRFKAKNKTAE